MPFRLPKVEQISLWWYGLGVLLGVGVLYALRQLSLP